VSDGFDRTRETATQAAATAGMLKRIAEGRGSISQADVSRLRALSDRYLEYAEALVASLPTTSAEPDPEQVPLL
jgi:hypothetical protein